MKVLSRNVSSVAPPSLIRAHYFKSISRRSFTHKVSKSSLIKLTQPPNSKLTMFTAISPSVSTEPTFPPEEETINLDEDEKFDWFSHWYPLMPVCDLDKRAPVGKKVLGLDVVVWWDKNHNAWKVFDDRCSHRLAPLSQGRIDQRGRLQCVYHGWCFDGSGDCKLIPQAPHDGPPVHSFPKACVAVYPSTVQNGIVWFWPNTDPEYKDILAKKKPPYIPEVDDPSYDFQIFNRDIPYGYEVLIENLMDPSHVPYAHHGITKKQQPSGKLDREGGLPIDMKIQNIDKTGFKTDEPNGIWNFVSPCLLQLTFAQEKLARKPHRSKLFIVFCIPVSPSKSRVISIVPKNLWIDYQFVSRWMHHMVQNLIFDSDLYLLRIQEEKLMAMGPSNWQKSSFVPTNADGNVVAYRKWLKKYAGGQIDWGTMLNGSLSPIPPRKQVMNRYWSHVVNCTSCNGAYKGLHALQITLGVLSVVLVTIMVATKPGIKSVAARNTIAIASVLCFVGSKWLSHFIYKNFHFHDYNHAFK